MDTLKKLQLFKEKGWTYDNETGNIISNKGKVIKSYISKTFVDYEKHGVKTVSASMNQLAWYFTYGKSEITYHIDGNKYNNKINNLTNECVWRLENKKGKEYIEKVEIKEKPKRYINDVEFTYEMILSKGLGKLTPKAESMLIRISNELITRFRYNNYDDLYDCKMNGLYNMLLNWKLYDHNRYDKAFPYFTEICKRGIAQGLNIITNKDNNDYFRSYISLGSVYTI